MTCARTCRAMPTQLLMLIASNTENMLEPNTSIISITYSSVGTE